MIRFKFKEISQAFTLLFLTIAAVIFFLKKSSGSIKEYPLPNDSKLFISKKLSKDERFTPIQPAWHRDSYIRSGIISLNGAHDLTISGKSIAGGRVPAIALYNCYNIRITGNKLYNSSGAGIHLYNCENITVDHNYFTNVSTGVYAEQIGKGRIVVNYNQFLNMQGPFPRGQCIQFNGVSGPGNIIAYNRCENVLGKSNAEDAISLYKSNGTADSPIIIKGNWIRGGGPSRSGGGIMLGDNGGSYQTASENKLVDPGQYGIAISGGDHNAILNNSIYARCQAFTNVGLYVAGYNGSLCTNSTVAGNKVRYFNHNNQENDAWISPGTSKPAGWETNSWGADIGPYILPQIIINN